ncbi:MAG: NAD-dependent epimerase/dehydratase family protein [Parcubacteria group bacterium]|nr:NAD-dependent epimerase/dehydratase family protein [Parcubacteria group bacterium]
MRMIVTGGAGFIGSHLVDALIERGDEVLVIDNFSTGKRENVNPRAEVFQSDISRSMGVGYFNFKPAFSRYQSVDFVFHLAALPKVQYSLSHPKETNNANIDGTLNVIALAIKLNAKRLIYSSSSSIYGNQSILPLKEDMPVDPLSPYALQKFAAERYCQMLFKKTVCLRYFNVYGSRQSSGDSYSAVIGTFLRNSKMGAISTIYGDGEQTRDFTWVGDVVRANILAAESAKVGNGEIINIGGGKNYSVNQLAKMIGGLYHYQPARKGESRHTLADISKARELLYWEPTVDLPKGIAELKRL